MRRGGYGLPALAALAAVACGGGEGSDGGPSADAVDRTQAEAPAASRIDTVDVFLEEYLIDIPARLSTPAVLRVANVGSEPHNLRIGPAGTGEWPVDMGDLDPGGTRYLELDLAPGSHDVICDLAGHDMRGMRTELEVVVGGR